MLVLSRKVGQRIVIGGNIEVTIAAVRGRHVKLTIRAPRDVPIQREEIIGRSPSVALVAAAAIHDRFLEVPCPRLPR